MAKANKTRFAVLGMLAVAPMSGYEIRQTMRQSTANFWSESDGQLYPTLTQLSKEGLVKCVTANAGGRARKEYRITAQGQQVLQDWLKQPYETQNVRNEFMLKLFFGANTSAVVSQEHLQAQRYQIKAQLQQLSVIAQQLKQDYPDSKHLPYWLMTIDYGIRLAEAKLQWCEASLPMLKKLMKQEK